MKQENAFKIGIIIIAVLATSGVVGFLLTQRAVEKVATVEKTEPVVQTKTPAEKLVAKSNYKNQKYNFSFSYPANFTYRDTEPSLALQKSEVIIETSIGHNVWSTTIARDAMAEIVNDGVDIEVRKRENKTANAFPVSLRGDQGPAPIKREETKIGGVYAMHYTDADLVSTSKGEVKAVNETYVVEKDGYVYTISSFGTNAEYRDILTEIVNSFTFQDSLGSVVNWQIYTDAKNGFEFSYPGEFGISTDAGPVPVELDKVFSNGQSSYVFQVITWVADDKNAPDLFKIKNNPDVSDWVINKQGKKYAKENGKYFSNKIGSKFNVDGLETLHLVSRQQQGGFYDDFYFIKNGNLYVLEIISELNMIEDLKLEDSSQWYVKLLSSFSFTK